MNYWSIQFLIFLRQPTFFFMCLLFGFSSFSCLGALLPQLDRDLSIRLFWLVFELVLILLSFVIWYPEQQSHFYRISSLSPSHQLYYLLSKILVISLYILILFLGSVFFWMWMSDVKISSTVLIWMGITGLCYSLLSGLMLVMLSGLLISCRVRHLAFPIVFFPLRLAILFSVSEMTSAVWVFDWDAFYMWGWILFSAGLMFAIIFWIFSNFFFKLVI